MICADEFNDLPGRPVEPDGSRVPGAPTEDDTSRGGSSLLVESAREAAEIIGAPGSPAGIVVRVVITSVLEVGVRVPL